MELEQRCLRHINERLDDPITDEHLKSFKVAFRSWKSCFDIYDIDLYHKIAQALEVKELSNLGGIHYILNVPTDSWITDHWTVRLCGDRDKEFLEKYGQHYEVRR